MAMEMKRGEGDPMMEMNMTPLIDVMLVLITLLIITLPIQTHAVKLDMPSGKSHPGPFLPVIVNLGIDFDGTVLWNGAAVDRATLFTRTPFLLSRARRVARFSSISISACCRALSPSHPPLRRDAGLAPRIRPPPGECG